MSHKSKSKNSESNKKTAVNNQWTSANMSSSSSGEKRERRDGPGGEK